LGEWAESGSILPMRGKFDVSYLRPTMERLDQISHRPQTRIYVECVREFYTSLTRLYRATKTEDLSDKIAAYLSENYLKEITLEHLCERFNFSKNHIINVFKNGYGVTPVHYINDLRLTRAMYLLEVTSNTIESVAYESGHRDYSHFYRSFYRKNGLSPQAWREKIQKK
jgi:transcriptional regulator GlxA family with amidase domain